jgi:hypothetical protein
LGFNEDDRIRNKNKKYDKAYETYENLKKIGLSDLDIISHVQKAMLNAPDNSRFDIFTEIVRYAKKIIELNK